MADELRQFAIRNKMSHCVLTDLLHILQPLCPELPLHAKSLLKTPRKTTCKRQLDNGAYIHFGIKTYLQLFYASNIFETNVIKMSFNIDGLPLFKSSSITFWPIHSFVCDAPAHAFIKCVKSPGGYSCCDKCTVEGDYINKRVIFNSMSSPARTDELFLLQNDEEHHVGTSPLTGLNIGMGSKFPIDYMHSLCLGVMKKLLTSWVNGPLNVRLASTSVKRISTSLERNSKFFTSEFNRKSRSL